MNDICPNISFNGDYTVITTAVVWCQVVSLLYHEDYTPTDRNQMAELTKPKLTHN